MDIVDILKKRGVFILDGAMGTNLVCARKFKPQNSNFKIKDTGAEKLTCSEAYNMYAPDLVLNVHKSFISAGCDMIETNTFNGNRISLAEYGLENRVREINEKAVSIAKNAAKDCGRAIFISGDIGPTSKLPSMGQISFDDLHSAYLEQAEVLINAGVDLIQIDTCQDILQAKTAVIACNDIFERSGARLPVIVTVTIDSSGRLLLGTEPSAVLAALLPLGVSAIGLNCGLGPKGMEGAVRFLAHNSPLPVAVIPNAGLPEIVGGETKYNLSPEEFAEAVEYYVSGLGVEIVGGCCGTTPEHLSALVKKLNGTKPAKRKVEWRPQLSSLFQSTTIKQSPAPLIVAERMNINGSKKFRKFILSDNYEEASMMASGQERAGAHVIDISVAYAGRDEIVDFTELLKQTAGRAQVPICIDSTKVEAMEAALKMIPGRAIINSINLEDGGVKAKRILGLAKRFGAAVIALTIDEGGMAKDADKKCKIAGRLIKLCGEFGIEKPDIFIDPLTFTLAEPRAAEYGSGAQTLEAIKKIKKKYGGVNTILGISNVSYGFGRNVRRILNSVFLHEAIKCGLDSAIVHAGQIVPLSQLDGDMIRVSLELIGNLKKGALDSFMRHFEGREIKFEEVDENIGPQQGVRLSIIRGDKIKITGFLDKLIKTAGAREILNNILLPAMGEVGGLFDKGEIPLPFVLQSAEAMKAATDHLSSHFESKDVQKKGKIVLATVRGDVHDIGKNLVDIILSNNGFEVFNIGVKQTVENILNAVAENKADVIGLSSLLVESALIMKDDLEEMAHRGIEIPVICGGAALTKKFVEKELASVYKGRVFYAADAFEGLRIMEGITCK